MLDDIDATAESVIIEPFNLQRGEAAVVGRALAGVLRRAVKEARPPAAPAADLSGSWEVRVAFLHGARRHLVTLTQHGGDLTGEQQSDGFAGPVHGSVSGDDVRMTFTTEHEGVTIFYMLEGDARRMFGTAQFGAANPTNSGEFNLRQHGAGTWEAARADA